MMPVSVSLTYTSGRTYLQCGTAPSSVWLARLVLQFLGVRSLIGRD